MTEVSWVQSVLGPKCLYTKTTMYVIYNEVSVLTTVGSVGCSHDDQLYII